MALLLKEGAMEGGQGGGMGKRIAGSIIVKLKITWVTRKGGKEKKTEKKICGSPDDYCSGLRPLLKRATEERGKHR